MGYSMDLRKKVGHAPLMMPAGCVIFLDAVPELRTLHRGKRA